MLSDLASQESSVALGRRLRRYVQPRLLCVDEVGYLSYDNRYADLLFEVVTRRYDGPRSIPRRNAVAHRYVVAKESTSRSKTLQTASRLFKL